MDKHQQVIDILSNARQDVAALLTDEIDRMHALRIDSDLQKLTTSFGMRTGNQLAVAPAPTAIGPATTFMGEELEVGTAKTTKPEQLKMTAEEKAAFKAEVDNAFEAFSADQFSAAELMELFNDRVIRGVAKKAGLKVTAADPEHIDDAYVAEIREKIKADAQAKQEADAKAAEQAKTTKKK